MEEDFEDVAKFFKADEWNEIVSYERLRYQTMFNNYKDMIASGLNVPKPYFMNNEEKGKPETDQVADMKKKFKRKCVVETGMRKRSKLEETAANNRYPKRNIPAKNYVEAAEIPEDRYVYCDKCMHEHLDLCKKHALVHVYDTKVPGNNPNRARDTVPSGFVEVKESKIKDGGEGIWAVRTIPKGIRFGPYEGVTGIDHTDGRYSWQIKKNGRVISYINGYDTAVSNWMRYVNCARNKDEQNLMAYQYRGKIYYRSVVEIQPHTELLVFYGSKFAKELGIDVKNYNNSPTSNQFPENVFKCENCFLQFSSPIYLEQHVTRCSKKYVATEDNNDSVLSDGRYECKLCSVIFTVKSLYDGHMNNNHPVYTNPVAAEGDTVSSHQGYHAQYVEPELYASQPNKAEAQMAYPAPVYVVDEYGTMYAITATGTAASTGTLGYTAGAEHSPVQQAVDNGLVADVATATVHSTATPGQTSEEVTSALSPITSVFPVTVQWLLENYETADGVSIPRSTVYSHYLRHCAQQKLKPVNATSFGKLIRLVFLSLRTKRLGPSGNSEYHYCGIRVKPGSNLTGSVDETSSGSSSSGQGSIDSGRFEKSSDNSSSSGQGSIDSGRFERSSDNSSSSGQDSNDSGRFERSSDNSNASSSMITQRDEYLGEGTGAIPDFPKIHFTSPLPDNCSLEDVDTFRSIYRKHCEAFLNAVMRLEFSSVELLWREFWCAQDNHNGDEEKYLSKSKLFTLCTLDPIQSFIQQVDVQFYHNLVQVLLPDVLRPIPSSLTQAIRNFAKGVESWLRSAMSECPPAMLNVKLTAVSTFGQRLRRYTSLNHLAQVARPVLQNGTQLAQMLADLNRVDFQTIQEKASWVCQCDRDTVQRLVADFKLLLQQPSSLEHLAVWLQNVVQNALQPYGDKASYSQAAKEFLLNWSFFSSMVIRDLTLMRAASFGSVYSIRLLFDEYMSYLIEQQVAQANGRNSYSAQN